MGRGFLYSDWTRVTWNFWEMSGSICSSVQHICICAASVLSSLNWWDASEGLPAAAQEAPRLQKPQTCMVGESWASCSECAAQSCCSVREEGLEKATHRLWPSRAGHTFLITAQAQVCTWEHVHLIRKWIMSVSGQYWQIWKVIWAQVLGRRMLLGNIARFLSLFSSSYLGLSES